MSKEIEKGSTVKVIGCEGLHGFKVGQELEVVGHKKIGNVETVECKGVLDKESTVERTRKKLGDHAADLIAKAFESIPSSREMKTTQFLRLNEVELCE